MLGNRFSSLHSVSYQIHVFQDDDRLINKHYEQFLQELMKYVSVNEDFSLVAD